MALWDLGGGGVVALGFVEVSYEGIKTKSHLVMNLPEGFPVCSEYRPFSQYYVTVRTIAGVLTISELFLGVSVRVQSGKQGHYENFGTRGLF